MMVPVYTTIEGKHYIAEISHAAGVHTVTIRNKVYRTIVHERDIYGHAPQAWARKLLREFDEKPLFEGKEDG